jgi:VanZ family protein
MRPAHWLPPVLWMGVIFWLSTDTASAEHTGQLLLPVLRWLLPWATPGQLATIHGLLRKGAHLTEYAILAALWYRAFRRGPTLGPPAAGRLAFMSSVAWAILDEWHQSLLPSRTSSAVDVAIDSTGAALALVLTNRGWRAVVDGATPILLWLAAAGGAAVIAINAWAGVPSGALWITTPAAGLTLLARSRLRRRKAGA